MARTVGLHPFEALVDEARAEGLRRHSGESHPARPHSLTPTLLATFTAAAGEGVGRRRAVAVPASMLLHGAAAVALAVVPILVADSLPGTGEPARAFFVEPLTVPPPPPPPPPPPRGAAGSRSVPRTAVQAAAFTAPIAVPAEIGLEDALDLGVEGGVPGGVEGGVPGGVVGGVVGGLPGAPAPPPPVVAPVRVGGEVRAPRKILDVTAEYPPLAARARLQGTVVIEATIDPSGHVANATVLRGVPMLDEAALAAVRKWVYTPTLLNGVPTPLIMTVTVTFQLRQANASA
ncbi:MAG TPA: TonB family protein [Vicinamibacteria bacterium]|nr:TonB family protein [Vicinamibacteria bacterium]